MLSPLRTTPFDDQPLQRSDNDAWDRVRKRLRAELGEDVFSSWFGRLELTDMTDGIAHLSVPTRFLKSWIQSHYSDRLQALLTDEFKNVSEIVLSVRGALAKPVQKPQATLATDQAVT